ncbi:hypothetical protein DL546_009177 [Coniochaeta pulveracea]|uniref:Uncharacterized protein n=1 Tax=Coniochaeta pulveracea TaxID=177199 RepID=A0A420YG94_9PEZI|nr:hypothetical protein DL546_009177 [Coniochaeta pulveracea]
MSQPPMPKVIAAEDMMTHFDNGFCLKYSRSNPGHCYCGRYLVYWTCGHQHAEVVRKCAAQLSLITRLPIFCRTPTPRVRVDNILIHGRCDDCLGAKNTAV